MKDSILWLILEININLKHPDFNKWIKIVYGREKG